MAPPPRQPPPLRLTQGLGTPSRNDCGLGDASDDFIATGAPFAHIVAVQV